MHLHAEPVVVVILLRGCTVIVGVYIEVCIVCVLGRLSLRFNFSELNAFFCILFLKFYVALHLQSDQICMLNDKLNVIRML